MLEQLRHIISVADYTVWYYLNATWHNYVLDTIVPFLRNQWTWAPLYLFLLVYTVLNFGWRGMVWCLFFLVTFGISDQLSAHFLKEIFERTRPCNNPDLSTIAHVIVPCGSGYSFPSSHAANHFALGVFGAITLRGYIKGIWWWAMIWAFSVAYAQVYVGVHFPFDVFCGGLLGVGVGRLTAGIFQTFFRLRPSEKNKTSMENNIQHRL